MSPSKVYFTDLHVHTGTNLLLKLRKLLQAVNIWLIHLRDSGAASIAGRRNISQGFSHDSFPFLPRGILYQIAHSAPFLIAR